MITTGDEARQDTSLRHDRFSRGRPSGPYGACMDSRVRDEPLADGMHIAIRLRRDFTVVDAGRVLAAARAAYLQLTPGATEDDAVEMVTCASDAIFTLFERDGMLGEAADARLESYRQSGLAVGGWVAQVTVDEPVRLLPGGRCLPPGLVDPFALAADA